MHNSIALAIDDSALAGRLEAAQAIAREAGRLAIQFRNRPEALHITLKGPQDFVTEADRAVERLVRARLRECFPGDTIIGEEYGGVVNDAAALWAIDPIDGTSNFVAGRPEWCVSIGLLVAGRPTIGAIYQPLLDDLYSARTGQGASRNGVPISVSGRADLAQATVCFEYSVGTPIEHYLGMLERYLRTGGEYRRPGACTVALAQIAAGSLDGFVELAINLWDVLAGIVLIREAGGWTNDFVRLEAPTMPYPMVAATPGIRDELLAVCNLDMSSGA